MIENLFQAISHFKKYLLIELLRLSAKKIKGFVMICCRSENRASLRNEIFRPFFSPEGARDITQRVTVRTGSIRASTTVPGKRSTNTYVLSVRVCCRRFVSLHIFLHLTCTVRAVRAWGCKVSAGYLTTHIVATTPTKCTRLICLFHSNMDRIHARHTGASAQEILAWCFSQGGNRCGQK